MKFSDLVKFLQSEMNKQGERLAVDGDPGPKTQAALERFDVGVVVTRRPESVGLPPVDPEKPKKSPPWYLFALKFKGKRETDKEFSDFMVPKWKLLGLNLGTIATSWAAWCGLAMAVALSGVGIDYAKNGALARNWGSYGVVIDWKKDGIPQGAIVHINHSGNCSSSSSNHVAQANGDCTAAELLKKGAAIDLYGGNQGNTWKVSSFSASTICNVRWPKDVKDYPKPGPVTKSINCSSKNPIGESTR